MAGTPTLELESGLRHLLIVIVDRATKRPEFAPVGDAADRRKVCAGVNRIALFRERKERHCCHSAVPSTLLIFAFFNYVNVCVCVCV